MKQLLSKEKQHHSKTQAHKQMKMFDDVNDAINYASQLYETATRFLREGFIKFARSNDNISQKKVRAYYPYIKVYNHSYNKIDSRLPYGFVAGPGVYATTITRTDLFDNYFRQQLELLKNNHPQIKIEIGQSDQPIPIHFAFKEGNHLENKLDMAKMRQMRDLFDLPDLNSLDDRIVNNTLQLKPDEPCPLSLFTAARVDFSLHRLRHYTATSSEHFQKFILFTNYQFYIEKFIAYGRQMMSAAINHSDNPEAYEAFVEPGNSITYAGQATSVLTNNNILKATEGIARSPQMPAYHLKRADGSGITMVNIGVGPSNAKTITDHIAVLRPHAWLMLGHCAGLRNTQRLGDYVLAHGYVREDHVLDADLPLWVPIPALADIQIAIEKAVAHVTKLEGMALKQIMRTGTVATVDNRNWELREHHEPVQRFSQSRAIALDMESATIAANGFRFRIPYGSLLCVSDKPLHGELKLPGMADHFYQSQVEQHLQIGIQALTFLRNKGLERLHSRKLRSFAEVAFQ